MLEGSGERFQQSSRNRQDTPQSSSRGTDKEKRFQWIPEQVMRWFQLGKQSNQVHQTEKPFDQLLARAKQGVEAFKKTYDTRDTEWKQLLTETELGECIQAMYLGLKPATYIEEPSQRGIVIRNLERRFGIVRTHFVYDGALVQEAITSNPDIFSDYQASRQSIDAYMREFNNAAFQNTGEYMPQVNNVSERMLQHGILFGYPRNAVLQHAYYRQMDETFKYTTGTYGEPLTSEEEAIRTGYVKGYSDTHFSTEEEYRNGVNRYRDEHRHELQSIIQKVFPKNSNEAKNYLLTERFVQLPGFVYALGNPKPGDYIFAQRVRDVFEQSGMNAFLRAVKP